MILKVFTKFYFKRILAKWFSLKQYFLYLTACVYKVFEKKIVIIKVLNQSHIIGCLIKTMFFDLFIFSVFSYFQNSLFRWSNLF